MAILVKEIWHIRSHNRVIYKSKGKIMGHTWRELFPEQAAEHDYYINRRRKLIEKLKKVSASKFTVDQLRIALSIVDYKQSPSSSDFDTIESLLKKKRR